MNKGVILALYSVRDQFMADSQKTLRAVSEIGYSGVEFAGLGNSKAQDVRAQLDEFGLKAVSAHVPFQRLHEDLAGVIKEAKVLGMQFIVFPWLPPEQRTAETYRALLPALDQIGKTCRSEGLGFCYHNHDFELEKVFGNLNVLEFFAQNISPEHLTFEPDVYWAKFSGIDPVDFLKSFTGRVPLVHFKDMAKDDKNTFAEVGSGSLDFPSILKTSEQIGAQWNIVEQDKSKGDPMDSAASSFNYLKTLGLGQ